MHQRFPLSNTKSKLFHSLRTPSTRHVTDFFTPTSQYTVPKLCFDDTPAFLKRDSQRADVEKENVMGGVEEVSWSPVAMRKLPKAAGRGLSALVRGLREMEDEGLDEELDLLREMEGGGAPRNQLDQPKILAHDNQRPEMPLGPAGGLDSDEDDVDYIDDRNGKDGKPLKVWKKKGQKRTTRRVLMKPSTAKWKPEPAWNGDDEDGVAERQVSGADRSTDHGCNGDGYEDVEQSQGKMAAGYDGRHGSDDDLEKIAEGRKKKISATAHANFRALKIKSKQSKGKMGGKFKRKR